MALNKPKIANYLLILIIIIFISITFKGLLNPLPGDENVYFYGGKLISEGKIPYRDFFLAHPPFHSFVLGALYKLFGFNVFVLKLVPFISTIVTAVLIYLLTRNFGEYQALLSTGLFLFCYTTMFNSVFAFGISFATMLMVLGLYLYTKNKFILSGLIFGLAASSRLLILIPFGVLLFYTIKNKKNFLKIGLGFVLVFGLVNLLMIFLTGANFIEQVYTYHIMKNYDSYDFTEYFNVLKLNWILFLSFVLIFFFKKNLIQKYFAVSLVYLLFLLVFKQLFGFYLVVVVPFLAIVGGAALIGLFDKLKKIKVRRVFVKTLIGVFVLVFLWDLVANVLFINLIGFSGYGRGPNMEEFILYDPSQNLFGDESIVPLLSMQTGKDLVIEVDTNDQVYLSGLRDINLELFRAGQIPNLLFIIRDSKGISSLPETQDFLNTRCELESKFKDKIEGSYLFYRC